MSNKNSNSENKSFESLKYNILDTTDDILLDNSCDPDSNYFNKTIIIFDTAYVIPTEFHSQFKGPISAGLSSPPPIPHPIIIRSINKNFENFILSLSFLCFTFSVIS